MDDSVRINLERRLPKQAMALVLAGGRGSRLKQLTDVRCKPAVYFGRSTSRTACCATCSAGGTS